MAIVSICIPAYENEAGVERLLASIAVQTYEDYEVIITDDSADASLKRLADQYEKVAYYHNPVRLGPTANWNAAVLKSSGTYVKIMHHDDWFTSPESLAAFVSLLLSNPGAVLAFSGSRQAQEHHTYDRHIQNEDAARIEADWRNLFLGNTIGAPSAVLYLRGSQLFDEALTWLVDTDFYMGLLQNGRFCYTDKPLVTIGIGKDQLTEQCRDDGEINTREYGYLYEKYELWKEKPFRDKLMQIFADAGKPYAEAAPYHISKKDYRACKLKKLIGKIKWKLGIRNGS